MASYRHRRDDSSDDEGPTKRVKHDEDDEVPFRVVHPKASSRNVWADVAIEESLAMGGSGMNILDKKDTSQIKIKRGAETYTVPADAVFDDPVEGDANLPLCTSDDPFGDHVDLGDVEAFGIRKAAPKFQPRGRGGIRGMQPRGSWFNRGGGSGRQPPVPKGDDDMETEGEAKEERNNATPDGGSRRGHCESRGGWRAGRGTGPAGRPAPRRRGAWQRGGGGGFKRKFDDKHVADPAVLMQKEYSLASLMATEFPEGESVEVLGKMMADALGETQPDTIIKIVVAIGEKKALQLFDDTRKTEAEGGMNVANGARRRTPGGVFILLFKASDADPAVKDGVFAEGKQLDRKKARARRRNPHPHLVKKDIGDQLNQLEKAIEKSKEVEEGEATPSPEGIEGVEGEEELDYGEDEQEMQE